MTLYNQNLGKKGEKIAYEYLINNNFTVVEKNFRSKFGEIDIIAKKDNKIYFIEVKTRANLKKGKPYEAVNRHKINQLNRTSAFFLLKNNYKNFKYAISVVSILINPDGSHNLQFFDSIAK